jgi:type II secretory pathway component PulJ
MTRSHRHDDGLTLVELIIYISISALFLGLLAALFVNGLRAQAEATDRDSATGDANAALALMNGSIRNAVDFRVDTDGMGVVAEVAVGQSEWECRAWVVREGQLQYRSAHAALDTSNASAEHWSVIASGVSATLEPGKAFRDAGGRTLLIGMEIAAGDVVTAAESASTAQALNDGSEALQCWTP